MDQRQRAARARRRPRRCRTGSCPGRHRARARAAPSGRTPIERSFDRQPRRGPRRCGRQTRRAPYRRRHVRLRPRQAAPRGRCGRARCSSPSSRSRRRRRVAGLDRRPGRARGSATSACSCSCSPAGSSRCACTSSPTPTPPTGPAIAASRRAGYLTLNPFKYAHPLLSIVLPLFFIVQGGIGLPGGAVYLHPHAFRSKRAQSLAAAVGPADERGVRGRAAADRAQSPERPGRPTPAVLVGAGLPGLPAGHRGRAQPAADPGPRRLRDHRAVPRPADPPVRRQDQALGHARRDRAAAVPHPEHRFFDLVERRVRPQRREPAAAGSSATRSSSSG